MTTQSDLVQQLHEIAQNLWWCWHPDVWQLFEELDPTLWRETNRNPIALLKRLAPEQIERRAASHALAFRIQQANRRLRDYMADTGPRANREAGPLHKAPVAYFCAEFGLHESLPIYSGGLGILAGDHLKACSDLNIPLVGIGLFYAMGYFRQTVDASGRQQEHYDRALASELPITKVVGADGQPVEIVVESGAGPIYANVWRAQVGRISLYLLDADVSKNSEEDRALTSLLYGGDKRTRIRQELLLGVGGVRMLELLGIRPGVYHLNEGHSAFAPLELCHQLMRREGLSFDHAKRRVSKRTVFTTHTPVPAGHDRFELGLFEETMRPMREKLGLDHYTLHGLGRVNPNDSSETFCMTVLAIKMTDHRNGVSHIHGRVSRHMWRDLWPHKETHTIPIGHITNGVHVGTFLAPQMRTLYDKYLAPDWERHMDRPEAWTGLDNAEPGEVWEIHQILKSQLIDFVGERVQHQQAPRGEQPGQLVPGSGLDPNVLTIGFARRFATYKRANLLFSDMERFKKLLLDADRPIQVIFAGKAHPKDEGGKQLIQNIIELTTSPEFKGRVVFLSDYNTNIARHLVRGVDIWLNNPRRPQEACGTSGQKAVLNGVLNCSILDGWWAEGYDGQNGFAIGDGTEHDHEAAQDDIDAEALYDVLEREVIPLYYKRAQAGLPLDWIDRMKWNMVSLGWRFNANRMVLDYMRNAYLPAVGATTARIG
jgi:glycogen phosphorylase